MLPPPVPVALGLPAWLKAMPTQAFSAMNGREENTVKRCPPFVDAMTCGFLIPLMCDLRVENGEPTWDNDIPPGGAVSFSRSPVAFHDSSQVERLAAFEDDRFLIKFHNLWTVEAPEGYAGAVHRPGQPFRSAVHHADRTGRLRPLPRQLDLFSRRTGTTLTSAVCCRRARRSRNAYR